LKGAEPRPLFAFAGLWRRHVGPIKKDGPSVEIDVYSFMTTTPNVLVGSINHERMPVLLSGEADFDTWVSGSTDEAFTFVREYLPEKMRMVQSGLEKAFCKFILRMKSSNQHATIIFDETACA
jgi:putative SOS response-associated peptidase YedK